MLLSETDLDVEGVTMVTRTLSEVWDLPFCRSFLAKIKDSPPSRWSNDSEWGMNISILINEQINEGKLGHASPQTSPRMASYKLMWFQVLLPIICVLGISGNLLNLVILTRKRFCAPMGKLEQSANMGMIGLALSDLLFCLTVLPYSFVDHLDPHKDGSSRGLDLFVLYYRVYGISLINFFIMSSTWLIVALALERYTVLYFPLQAKVSLSRRKSIAIIVIVYVACCLLTLPYFLNREVRACMGLDNQMLRYESVNMFDDRTSWSRFLQIYIRHIWPVIAVFLPQVILFVCNVRLLQGLRSVHIIRRLKCPGQKIRDVNSRITLTLIIIVAMAIILVTPAEILKAVNPYMLWGETGHIIASVANLLQTFNFAFNFVLYCALDRHFRHICRGLFVTQCKTRKSQTPKEPGILMLYRQGTGTSFML